MKEYRDDSYTRQEDALDRMRRLPKSWVNLFLVAFNITVFAVMYLTGAQGEIQRMVNWGAACAPLIHQGEYYRLITCMFLHFDVEHLFQNMLLLFFLGDQLERVVGRFSYLLIYLGGGLGGSLLSYWFHLQERSAVVSAGASGAVFAVVGAMIYVVIRNKGRLEEISFPRLAAMAVLSVYVGFVSEGVDNTAHIGGLLAGFLWAVLLYHRKTQPRLK